ncbi:Cleavage stimulation factor subunit [Sesamum angolense]|uniref:Cleavage stimulation factor subunit n=1 Tax=Sesamum angolense TaxID=2727404 RepID=A0AAE2C158_9LAMI|nr:Cleavage stimulation factor subunit [Sesamum angolense]
MASETAESNPVSVSDGNADKYNVEAAEILANEALRSPISDAVPIYEQLLATFPTSAKYWKQYVEAFMAANNDEATRQVFSRCLLNCLQVPLWRCYIRFIRKVNDKKGIEGQEETKKAYEFMLSYVGADIASGPVWMEYIAYLKSVPAQTTLEESQRMTAIRKTYQRAIVMPTHHVEQLWRDYENFENSVSRALAKGLLAEYQPKYNSARAVYRERKKYVDEIDWNMLAVPPSGSSKEEMQWTAWKRLLSFEKNVVEYGFAWPLLPQKRSFLFGILEFSTWRGNPQRIDNASANKRIAFAYEQCLMYLYHYPDIWYDYAMWHAQSGSRDSAIKVFQRALKALPDSEMLKYAYAELEESHGAAQAAKKVYESLLGDGSNATALSHIQFIRFLRRTEGVEAARRYFLDARKSPNCSYHVYVAYAMMAFCLDKDAKEKRKRYQRCKTLPTFLPEKELQCSLQFNSFVERQYADFLCRLNDDRNTRALFERALSSLPPDESVETSLLCTLKCLLSGQKLVTIFYSTLIGYTKCDHEYSFLDGGYLFSSKALRLFELGKRSRIVGFDVGCSWISMWGSKVSARNHHGKVVHPDVSRMVTHSQDNNLVLMFLCFLVQALCQMVGTTSAINDVLKSCQPLWQFGKFCCLKVHLPMLILLSICLQSNITTASRKSGTPQQLSAGPAPSTSDLSGSSKFKQTRDRQPGKRKDSERQDDDDTSTVQSQPLPRDAFKIRQLQKSRASSSRTGGSASYGSGFSGDLSGSSG